MGYIVKLHEFLGEKEILDAIKGLKLDNVEYMETEECESILSLTFIKENGDKKYLQFTDGTWHFGEETADKSMSNFKNFTRQEQTDLFEERIGENWRRPEIYHMISLFTAYNYKFEKGQYDGCFDEMDIDEMTDLLSEYFTCEKYENTAERAIAWDVAIETLGTDKIWDIIDNICKYMDEYHEITVPLEDTKAILLRGFATLKGESHE